MAKRYYEHEDYYGKKFYSEDPYDPRRKEAYPPEPMPILLTVLATGALIICPLILRFIHIMCFGEGFSWGGLIVYLILLAIIYGGIGWCAGGRLFRGNFQEDVTAIRIAVTIAYIISLIVIFIFPSSGDPVFSLKWYDYVMSGVFAYTLTLDPYY